MRNYVIIPKNTYFGKLRYTVAMRKYLQSPIVRRTTMNYLGGLGYYGWFFALLLIVTQLGVQASQYFVSSNSQPVRDTPSSVAAPQATGVAEVGLAWNAAAIMLMLVATVGALLMPYYIGWLSRKLPRWVIAQTSHPLSRRTIHRVKQIACMIVVVMSTLLLFAPYESGLTSALYVTTLAALVVSMGIFWLQHKTATLWRIPERDVF